MFSQWNYVSVCRRSYLFVSMYEESYRSGKRRGLIKCALLLSLSFSLFEFGLKVLPKPYKLINQSIKSIFLYIPYEKKWNSRKKYWIQYLTIFYFTRDSRPRILKNFFSQINRKSSIPINKVINRYSWKEESEREGGGAVAKEKSVAFWVLTGRTLARPFVTHGRQFSSLVMEEHHQQQQKRWRRIIRHLLFSLPFPTFAGLSLPSCYSAFQSLCYPSPELRSLFSSGPRPWNDAHCASFHGTGTVHRTEPVQRQQSDRKLISHLLLILQLCFILISISSDLSYFE